MRKKLRDGKGCYANLSNYPYNIFFYYEMYIYRKSYLHIIIFSRLTFFLNQIIKDTKI